MVCGALTYPIIPDYSKERGGGASPVVLGAKWARRLPSRLPSFGTELSDNRPHPSFAWPPLTLIPGSSTGQAPGNNSDVYLKVRLLARLLVLS